MKLYIRSQDKETLVVADCLYYREDYNTIDEYDGFNENKVFTHFCGGEFELGHYKTKERCLEIIDEIQNIMCRSGMILFKDIDITHLSPKDIEPFKAISWCSSPIANEKSEVTVHTAEVVVYEMPEE